MSMQDVNLLTEDLRPKRELFTFRDLMLVWGGFLGLLLCYNGYQSIGWLSQEERAAEVREHLRAIQTANAALTAEAQRKPEPSLVASVAELNAVRAERELLATLLQDVATSDGFSERLEDLARFKLQGIWLDGVYFGDGGTQVRLRGFSETPGRVPEYLSALSAGAGFSGYSFEGFELSDAPNNLVKFELAGPDSAVLGRRWLVSDTPGTIGKLKARYGALTLRERAIITVALLGTTWCLWLITASDYLTSRESEVTRQVRQTEVELRLATEEQQRLRRARSADPNDALRAEQAAVKAVLERLDASMANSLSRFVPPERMSELLADLLAEHRGLKLKLVRRLPSRALASTASDRAAADGDDEAPSGAGDRGPAPPNLYLHPLRLEVEGRYFDVLGYVQALEDSPWRFNWRRFDYETATYPRGRAVIEIETLSRDPRWLGV